MPACHYQRSLPLCRWRQSGTDPSEGEQQTKEDDAGRERDWARNRHPCRACTLPSSQLRGWLCLCVSPPLCSAMTHPNNCRMSWHEILCNRSPQGNETSGCWKVSQHHLPNQKKRGRRRNSPVLCQFTHFTQKTAVLDLSYKTIL